MNIRKCLSIHLFLILVLFTKLANGQIGETLGASNYLKESMPAEARELGEFMSYDGTRIAANGGTSEIVIFALTGNGWIEEDVINIGEERFNDISISGDILAVGAPINDDLGENAGVVLIYTRDGAGQWSESIRLNSGTQATNQRFGNQVSLDGTNLAVSGIGNLWAMEFGGGTWSAASLVGSEATDIRFAEALEISGNRIVVGADRATSNGSLGEVTNSGFAYVYVNNGGTWSLEQTLQASNAEEDDFFGTAVDIDGDRIIVGAELEDSNATGVGGDGSNNGSGRSGAAYIFERNTSSGLWEEKAYLKGSATGANDGIGSAVAIDGDVAVLGAEGEDSNATEVNGNATNNNGSGSGAAWVYERVEGAWQIGDYLKAPNAENNDSFGIQVGVSGSTVIVAAHEEFGSANVINGRRDLNFT